MSVIDDLRIECRYENFNEVQQALKASRAKLSGRVEEALVLGHSNGVVAARVAMVAVLRRACIEYNVPEPQADLLVDAVKFAAVPVFEAGK